MSIAGERPESGIRIAIERPRDTGAGAPWTYAGRADAPEATYPIRVVVEQQGDVRVEVCETERGTEPPADLAEKVRLIVRAAFRQAKADGAPPARRIVRWRADA